MSTDKEEDLPNEADFRDKLTALEQATTQVKNLTDEASRNKLEYMVAPLVGVPLNEWGTIYVSRVIEQLHAKAWQLRSHAVQVIGVHDSGVKLQLISLCFSVPRISLLQ